MPAEHQQTTLTTDDGLALFCQSWTPEPNKTTVARLLLLHGYAEHSSRYREMAHFFVDAGIAVHTLDIRGHGRSAGPRGYVSRFADYLDDVDAMLAQMPEDGPPLFLLGHSHGGLIALLHALTRAFVYEGVIVTNPFLGFGIKVPWYKELAGKAAARLWPRLALPSGIDPTMVSHDVNIVDQYRRDPLVFQIATAGWFSEVQRAQAAVLGSQQLDLPLLLFYSDADALASPTTTADFARRLRVRDKKVVMRGGEFHEILNEPAHKEVYQAIIDWIGERAVHGSTSSPRTEAG